MTAWLSTNGTEIIAIREEYFTDTDNALSDCTEESVCGDIFEEGKARFMKKLEKVRDNVYQLGSTVMEIKTYYEDIIFELNEGYSKLCVEEMKNDVSSLCLITSHIIQLSTYVASNRGLGTIYYIKGNLTAEQHHLFLGNSKNADVINDMIRELNPDVLSYHYFIFDERSSTLSNIAEMEIDIFGNIKKEEDIFQALQYFQRMDFLLKVWIQIIENNDASMKDEISSKQSSIYLTFLLTIFMTIIIIILAVPIIVFNAKMSSDNMTLYAGVMAHQNKMMKKEKQKTERLLNEMLPRSLAYK